MAIDKVNDGDTGLVARTVWNDNDEELDDRLVIVENNHTQDRTDIDKNIQDIADLVLVDNAINDKVNQNTTDIAANKQAIDTIVAVDNSAKIQANTDLIESTINSLNYDIQLGIDPDTLVEINLYKIDNTIIGSLPAGVSNSLTLKVTGFVNDTINPNKIIQNLYDLITGNSYERSANDSNTPVWSAWIETAISDKINNKGVVKFNGQTVDPTHVSGNTYYKDGILKVQGDNNETLSIGRQNFMEVVNNTGNTISVGSAVVHDGVISGQVQIKLALADSFKNSRVLGVIPYDILDGEVGVITTFGIVKNIDTSLLNVGTPIYISDITPGTFTNIAPDIASQVGGVLKSDISGEIFVSIDNNIALPTIIGELDEGVVLNNTLTTDVWTDLENFVIEDSIIMITDKINGTIGVTNTGKYRVNINLIMNFDNIGAGKKDVKIRLYATDGSYSKELNTYLYKDSTNASFYPNFLTELTENKYYKIQIQPIAITLTNVSFSMSTFDIESVHLR